MGTGSCCWWLLALYYRQSWKKVKSIKQLFFKMEHSCKSLRFAADSCNHLQPFAVTCSHKLRLAATCSHLQSLAATCSHWQPLALAATCSHWQTLAPQPLAATCSHLQPLAPTCRLAVWASGCKWLQQPQQVAASGCLSKLALCDFHFFHIKHLSTSKLLQRASNQGEVKGLQVSQVRQWEKRASA